MAASYAAKKPQLMEGVILLAAYAPADLSQTSLKLLSIYGSEDQVLNAERYQVNRSYLPAGFAEYRIDGGNHAFFADYGEQAGDGSARVSRQEQQRLTITRILAFLGREQENSG